MRKEYEIIFDYHDEYGFFPDEENVRELFVGTEADLNWRIQELRKSGGRNIFFHATGNEPPEEDDPYGDDWEEYVDPWEKEYIRSATAGDYSPSHPWDAPGMSISDFI